jgi:hypothetical protein
LLDLDLAEAAAKGVEIVLDRRTGRGGHADEENRE